MLQAMVGAMLQFVPVAAGGNVWRPSLVAGVAHPLLALASLVLVAGFLSSNGLLFQLAAILFVPVIGFLVVVVGARPAAHARAGQYDLGFARCRGGSGGDGAARGDHGRGDGARQAVAPGRVCQCPCRLGSGRLVVADAVGSVLLRGADVSVDSGLSGRICPLAAARPAGGAGCMVPAVNRRQPVLAGNGSGWRAWRWRPPLPP